MPRPFRRPCSHAAWLLAGLALLWSGVLPAGAEPAAAAPSPRDERGFPLVETRIPGDDDAGIQNFGVTAGPDGLLYVANLTGLLVHDGAWWERVPIGAGETAFSVAVDDAGRVAVGGLDDFGYVETGDRGRRWFVSLLDRLPEEERALSQVLTVLPRDGGFLFLGMERLVAWDGGERVEVLARFSPDPPYTFLFPVGDEILGWGGDGLARLEGPSLMELRLRPVPGGEAFRGRRIDQVLPADGAPAADALPGTGRPLLLSVRDEGLFLFRDGEARPFAPRASRWTRDNKVLAGLRLGDRRWVLGSVLGGLLVLRPDGSVEQVMDTSLGLPDDLVYDFAEDREGGLWVALNTDLARLPVASPLSVLDRRTGLLGSVYTVSRHGGDLWVGTASGLFRVREAAEGSGADRSAADSPGAGVSTPAPAGPLAGGDPSLMPVRAELVRGLPPAVWDLLSVGPDLLVATARGVRVLSTGGPAAGSGRPERNRSAPGGGAATAGTAAGPQGADLQPGEAVPVPGLERGVAYVLARSPSDPGRVWVAMDDRLVTLRRGHRDGAGAGGWRLEGVVEGVPGLVRTLVEKNGVLWCGSELDGVVGVELPLPAEGPPRLRRIPVDEPVFLFSAAGGILATHNDRVLRLDEAAAELVEDPALASVDRYDGLTHLAQDAAGHLWLNTLPPSFVPVRRGADGRPRWDSGVLALAEVPDRAIESILAEPDGTVWLAGSSGLYRHAGPPRVARELAAARSSREGRPAAGAPAGRAEAAAGAARDGGGDGAPSMAAGAGAALLAPLLARVTADGDELLFAGVPGQPPPRLDLASDLRRMRLDFAPLSFRPGLRYQVRLDPVDADWGPPSEDPFTEITRLAPGEYTLRVRVLQPGYRPPPAGGPSGGPSPVDGVAAAGAGSAGRAVETGAPAGRTADLPQPGAAGPALPILAGVSPETAWTFRVLPPWYRTPWAILLWLSLGLLAFVGYGGLRARTLRRRARVLEQQVRQRTDDLERAVAELRRTQGDLEQANHALKDLSLQDELTGIANRRRLQAALESEWRSARRRDQPLSFILLDLDHFKLLNDTRGHREGDDCLRTVARFLDRAVRADGPEGALVVRYGGEEFAVLLPDTGLPAALRIAEGLRAGLEALDLPHEASPEGRITASLGIATTVPSPGERIETLVENADLALYRAKTDGRNLIRADGMEDDSGPHRPVAF